MLRIAQRKGLAILLAGAAPLVVRLLLLPVMPMPAPRLQDEFTNLLAADTFAHGRLVNPPHPMWVHFESMHTLVRPVYASVFPVAQGLVLAAGQVLTGRPWFGVWLSVGLMCAALCWMLQAWVPPGWALAGGVLAALRFGVFSYWMNSYFGGAMAAVGGALVLGALPRIFRERDWRYPVLMGAGIAILANSRPYEGFAMALPAMGALCVWVARHRARGREVVVPMLAVLAIAGAGMGYYFSRFTGNPLLLPYSFYRSTVTMAPHFIWQSPRPQPEYRNRVLRQFYTAWEMECYRDARANRPPHGWFDKAKTYWRFYLGPFLSIPFLAALWLWKRPHIRYLLFALLWLALCLIVEVWDAPHYAAPATAVVLLVVVEGLRVLRRWQWRGKDAGALVVAIVFVGCAVFPARPAAGKEGGDGDARASIVHQLESTGGRHLVVVRYRLNHDPGDEWVYNGADIDSARVVWAREMDPRSNRALLRYFADRRAWMVEPDVAPVRISLYDASLPPDPPFQFVRLGTEGIAALRNPEEIREDVRREAARDDVGRDAAEERLSCDHWNVYFTKVTGVEAPDPTHGCFPAGDRGRAIGLDEWFAWLRSQR